MAQYIDLDGNKFVQWDDGTLSAVVLMGSLEEGNLFRLPDAQIAELQAIALPSTFALPSTQVTDLKTVVVSNFPASFQVSNFPASSQISNLPSTYPLSATQEALINAIKTQVESYSKGGGALNPTTLRTTEAISSNLTIVRSSVAAAAADTLIVAANPLRKKLHIYNDSNSALYIGLGSTAVSITDFTDLVGSRGRAVFDRQDAGCEVRGRWVSATGSARITEGT